jgi:oligoendopeptidase F
LIKQLAQITEDVRPLIQTFETSGADKETTESLLQKLRGYIELEEQAKSLLNNLSIYVHCERSVDGQNAEAQRVHSLLQKRYSALSIALSLVRLFLKRAPSSFVEQYLKLPRAELQRHWLYHSRELADSLLSEKEETLLAQMESNGIDAWGNLYEQISGSLNCSVHGQKMGLAEASSLLRQNNEPTRRAAWHGIQAAWKTHEESTSAILNSIAGWRIELCERRSSRRKFDYLDFPVHRAKLSRKTLDTMFEVVASGKSLGHRSMQAMARLMDKSRLDPWDLHAPFPAAEAPTRTYREGLKLVREAFGSIDSSMGDFIDTMEKNRWIEGRVLASKRPGAYCTEFKKSRTPRVFMTYDGSLDDIRTLAHELGHAYHAWVMRDLPPVAQKYPMTLAETASIFAEAAFADYFAATQPQHSQLEIAWQNAEAVMGYLLNIPARYDFERSFYDLRASGTFVTAKELGDLTESAWRKWYGENLSECERQFWMTKLHFSFSDLSFYNFPYTFGYLFSLGVYARREKLGKEFLPTYNALLRDTGILTTEELAKKHLNVDLSQSEFWEESLAIAARHVEHFEKLASEIR